MIKYTSKFGLANIGLQYFAMKNADTVDQEKAAIFARINEAVNANDEKAFTEAFSEWTKMVEDAVMAEARGYADAHDQRVLAGRGVRQLTSEETKFYNAFIQAAKSDNPKMALTGFSEVLPKTVIDAVFEDIIENHPLLDAINFENSGALVEYLYSSMDGRFQAIWGKLCAEITKELSGSFHKITFGQNKLSAFLPMCRRCSISVLNGWTAISALSFMKRSPTGLRTVSSTVAVLLKVPPTPAITSMSLSA